MYYPMRAIRDDRYKLIWNLAHPRPFPFAADLWGASSWQAQWQQGAEAPYGFRTVAQYLERPEFELYDLQSDPEERRNLAADAEYADILAEYQNRLRAEQGRLGDPWRLKWQRE